MTQEERVPHPAAVRGPSRTVLALLLGAWAAALFAGAWAVQRHQREAGAAGAAPASLPASASELAPGSRGPAVLWAFVHPQCPCTGASLRELEQVLVAHQRSLRGSRLSVRVAFYRPTGSASSWSRTASWRATERLAKSFPAVSLHDDRGGALARSMGVLTSGHVLLYDAARRLRFSGGVTISRGHEGSNPAEDALVRLLRRADVWSLAASPRPPALVKTPVFGCAL
jgi:hypothetical protein